jgi:hypothetical protein
MPTRMTWTILLSAVVVVSGLLFLLQADVEPGSPVILTVDHLVVAPPQSIAGIASIMPEQHVEVTATIEDVPIPGSPDFEMEGPVNRFEFPTTEDMRGKTVRIEARAADGQTRVTYVHVLN